MVIGQAPVGVASLSYVHVDAASKQHSYWSLESQRLYATRFDPSEDCSWQLSSRLVPGERSLILECLNGGSDGESFVLVFGATKPSGAPRVLFAADCQGTSWRLRASALVITSYPFRAYSSEVLSPNGTFVLHWSGHRFDTHLPSYCIPELPNDKSHWFH
jgi:hypothetical protein